MYSFYGGDDVDCVFLLLLSPSLHDYIFIQVWDIECGACLRILEGHDELVRCIRFDAKHIVSGAYDGKLTLFFLDKARIFVSLLHKVKLKFGIFKQHSIHVLKHHHFVSEL